MEAERVDNSDVFGVDALRESTFFKWGNRTEVVVEIASGLEDVDIYTIPNSFNPGQQDLYMLCKVDGADVLFRITSKRLRRALVDAVKGAGNYVIKREGAGFQTTYEVEAV